MNQTIIELEKQVAEAKQRLREAQRAASPEPVEDHTLTNPDGSSARLSELFGDHDELLVVHNMGSGCRYCSLWADGFVGLTDQLATRCAFVLCSDDAPDAMNTFSTQRGWTYRCVSGKGSDFAGAMGFRSEKGGPLPGISAFRKLSDGSIVRTGRASFGPGDDFCSVWHMLDLLPEREWQPL